jgi:hypothetical protein
MAADVGFFTDDVAVAGDAVREFLAAVDAA